MLNASALSGLKLTDAQRQRLDGMMQTQVMRTRPSLDAPWVGQDEYDQGVLQEAQYMDKSNRSRASHNRLVGIGKIASALPFAIAAAPALGIGGAATAGAASTAPPAFATSGIGFSSAGGGAATGGVLSRLSSIFGSKGFETAANVGMSLYGQNQSNKANDQARRDALATQAKEIELEQARLAQEAQNSNLDREELKAYHEAIQKLEQQKFALAQEQAQFERGVVEHDQAVKDNYRTTTQEPAAARLRSILGF